MDGSKEFGGLGKRIINPAQFWDLGEVKMVGTKWGFSKGGGELLTRGAQVTTGVTQAT